MQRLIRQSAAIRIMLLFSPVTEAGVQRIIISQICRFTAKANLRNRSIRSLPTLKTGMNTYPLLRLIRQRRRSGMPPIVRVRLLTVRW